MGHNDISGKVPDKWTLRKNPDHAFEDIQRRKKILSSVLLGSASGPANQTDRKQINRKHGIQISLDVIILISVCKEIFMEMK